jgi:ribosomal protein L16 Arg81 hydroxylase
MLGGSVSMTLGSNQFNWSTPNFPKPLVLPRITPEALKKSFKVAPNMRIELRGLADKIPGDVRDKIRRQLHEAQRQLEEAQAEIPTETLDKIQNELKELRTQLEKLRAERVEQEAEAEKAEKVETEADK